MEELENEIRDLVDFYYERKLKYSSYYREQELWDMVEDCISELQEIADKYEKQIDDYIYEREEAWEDEQERLKKKGIHLL
jgi:hypothetical protein